jgi:hypothetical protein
MAERYGAASRAERIKLLDEIVSVTGWHRKHAIRALRSKAEGGEKQRRPRVRLYGPVVEDALAALWDASDRLCAKRLKPVIAVLLPGLERHGRLTLSPVEREAVLRVVFLR